MHAYVRIEGKYVITSNIICTIIKVCLYRGEEGNTVRAHFHFIE
jgi:hypothetical protein